MWVEKEGKGPAKTGMGKPGGKREDLSFSPLSGIERKN
jgi:hypothetical protein